MPETTQGQSLSAVRAYTMVVKVLRERIDSGQYPVGDWLPTERVIAEDLNVDRRVARAAINQLIWDGYVDRRPHCRPTVVRAGDNTSPSPVHSNSGSQQSSRDNYANDKNESSAASSVAYARDPLSPTNIVALMTWYGGGIPENRRSQQRVFEGINHELAESGYHAVVLDLGQLGSDEDNAKREAAHLQYVIDKGLGGVIFYPHAFRSNQNLVKEVMRHAPLVMMDRRIAPVECDFVCTSNHKAMYDLVMHLVDQGHKRIALVTKYAEIQPILDRTRGYIDAAQASNIEELVLMVPSHDADWDWTIADTIFSLPEGKRPTAAVCFNDFTACLFQKRLERLGLSVPGDVALAGFDNLDPSLDNGVGLTTIEQPYEDIGVHAARLILQRLENPSLPYQSVELPGKLIVRDSSLAAPSN